MIAVPRVMRATNVPPPLRFVIVQEPNLAVHVAVKRAVVCTAEHGRQATFRQWDIVIGGLKARFRGQEPQLNDARLRIINAEFGVLHAVPRAALVRPALQ